MAYDDSISSANNGSKRTTPRVKKLRVKRKRKKDSSQSNSDFANLPPVVFVLTGVAFLLYAYGFVRSVNLLPAIDQPIDSRNRLDILVQKLSKAGLNVHNQDKPSGDDNISFEKDDNSIEEENKGNNQLNIRRKESAEEIDGVLLPEAKWPVSIRDEAGTFEDILHPGDKQTLLSVPKFWSPPLTGPDKTFGSLMGRDLATRFGSYASGHVDTDYKNKGSPDDRTIFVAIASYRDWQCRYTVESLLNRAKFPNRLRIAVVDQIEDGDPSCGVPIKSCESDPDQGLCKYIDQVDVIEVEARLAVGPVFARHIGHRLYRGEYYAMQIDAHVTFVQDWDVDIIEQMDATRNEMTVLSTYLTDIEGSIDETTGKSLRRTRPIMCNTDYEGGQGQHLRHGSQPEGMATIKDMPQMQPYWAAGWSFSRGHFVTNVPYDLYQPMIFMGEESSIGIRAFTYGYDHYAPQRSICFHTYANGKNARARNKVKHFWENSSLYAGTGVKAMKRLLGIIGMIPEVDPSEWDHTDEQLYGPGTERTLSKFFDTFGIDVVHKKVQHHLCRFVQSGNMHRQFLQFLRPDGMGIDYSKIDYKFVDPGS